MAHVDVAALERELRALWKETGDGGGPAQTRACTLNLVACAADRAAAEELTAAAQALTRTSPNRMVLVVSRPEAPAPALEAWVQANCVLAAPGVPQVCGEQITIDAAGPATAQVPSLVLSLLLPDLPVVLWLPGPAPLAEPLLRRLRAALDRVVVDSERLAGGAAGLTALAEAALAPPQPGADYRTGDLSWRRLTPWRELVAQFFDTRPFLGHLRRIDRVEIDYVGQGAPPVGALLLAGWLAGCLGWALEPGGQPAPGVLRLRRPAATGIPGDTRPVQVAFRPTAAPALEAGSLAAVRLLALDHTLARFSAERTDDPACARTVAQIGDGPPITRLARMEVVSTAAALAADLRVVGRDRVFEAALAAAGQMAAAL